MKIIDVLAQLNALNIPVVQTRDVATILKVEVSYASKLLKRLEHAGHIARLTQGLWVLDKAIDAHVLANYITAPFPSYISLQSALYFHGMISQIPDWIFVVSIARTKIFNTSFATISVHHCAPKFFTGYEEVNNSGIKMATPEKTLVDFCYFSTAKTRLFTNLPELELPTKFNKSKASKYIQAIPSIKRRSLVLRCFETILRFSESPWVG